MCLKYHFQFNSKDDRFEAIVVPRSRKSRTFESEDNDEHDTDYLQYAKEKLRDGRGCLIRDEYVDTGDSIEVPELCVELICKENTNVDVRSLNESKCRRRRNRKFWRKKNGKIQNYSPWLDDVMLTIWLLNCECTTDLFNQNQKISTNKSQSKVRECYTSIMWNR